MTSLKKSLEEKVKAEFKAQAAAKVEERRDKRRLLQAQLPHLIAEAEAKRKAEADAKELREVREAKATLSVSDLLSASGPVMRSPEKATPLSESELLELYSALSRQMPDSALSRHAGSPAIQLSPAVPFPCSPSATFAWPW